MKTINDTSIEIMRTLFALDEVKSTPVMINCAEQLSEGARPTLVNTVALNDPQNNMKITIKNKDGVFGLTSIGAATFKSEIIRSNNSVLTRWMKANGFTGMDVIQVDHSFDKKDEKNQELYNFFKEMLYGRFHTNFGNGRTFIAVWTSASGERTCTTTFMSKGLAARFIPWYTMNLPIMQGMPLEKGGIYLAQCTSSTHSWKSAFGNVVPYPNHIVLCNDVESTRLQQVVNYVNSGEVEYNKTIDVTETNSDGLILIPINWNGDKAVPLASLRAPGVKGLGVPFDRGAYKAVAEKLGIEPMVVDLWGNKHHIDDVDLILFKSSFKWSKVLSTEEQFKNYLDLLTEYGHKVYVCKEQHLRKRPLPYQQNQVAEPSAEDESKLVDYAVTRINKENTVHGAIGLLETAAERNVARLMPEFLLEGTNMENINVKHRSHMRQCLTGVVPNLITYPFAVPDMVNVCMHIMGVADKFCKFLPAGTVTFDNDECPFGKDLIVTRNPAPGMNVLKMHNVRITGVAKGFFITSALYFNSQDLSMRTLSMDFDGDTVGTACLENPIAQAYWNGLETAKKAHGYNCVYFENASPKTPYSRKAMLDKILDAQPSEVGLVIYSLTKIRDAHYNKGQATLMEAYATQCIDAAKNGVNADVQATMDACHVIMENAQKYHVASPMHIFFKKVLPATPEVADLERVTDAVMPKYTNGTPKYCARNTYIGRYVNSIRRNCSWNLQPEMWADKDGNKIPAWVDGRDASTNPSWKKFCVKAPTNVTNLYKWSDLRSFNNSVFGQVVNEITALLADCKDRSELKDMLSKVIPMRIEEMIQYARKTKANAENFDVQDLVSALVMALYGNSFSKLLTEKKSMLRTISDAKKVFWMMFGDIVFQNVVTNVIDDVKANDSLQIPEDLELNAISTADADDGWDDSYLANISESMIPEESDDEGSFIM